MSTTNKPPNEQGISGHGYRCTEVQDTTQEGTYCAVASYQVVKSNQSINQSHFPKMLFSSEFLQNGEQFHILCLGDAAWLSAHLWDFSFGSLKMQDSQNISGKGRIISL